MSTIAAKPETEKCPKCGSAQGFREHWWKVEQPGAVFYTLECDRECIACGEILAPGASVEPV